MKSTIEKFSEEINMALTVLMTAMFSYASLSKLASVSAFQYQLAQSPLIPPFSVQLLSYGVPIAELMIVVMLFSNRFKRAALFAFLFMMILFTVYLITLISINENLPCSCGGILGKMSFKVHIVFNVLFVLVALWAIRLQRIGQAKESYISKM